MTILFPDNTYTQDLCDRGRYAMMSPVDERINVAKDPEDIKYRKHVFNGLSLAMYKVIQAQEAGIISYQDRVKIFTYWKNYARKVLISEHQKRTVQNAAKSTLKGMGLVEPGDQVIVKVIKKKN